MTDIGNGVYIPLRHGLRFSADAGLHRCQGVQQAHSYLKCLGGERACPPEDCGGVPGYEAICSVLKDNTHPEHAFTMECLGAFDPDLFSPSQASAMISTLLALS